MQNVFIVGSKGIPASYGGFETFVDKLTEYHQDNCDIKYHVACKEFPKGRLPAEKVSPGGETKREVQVGTMASVNLSKGITESVQEALTEDVISNPPYTSKEFTYHNAHCFRIAVPNIGAAQAIYYDVAAVSYCCRYIKEHYISHPIVYILACRIGPWIRYFQRKIHHLGGQLYVNPDGHEFLRAKWPRPVRKYWKYSEWLMVKYADLLICDSRNIEKYIHEEYGKYHPKTTYIAYGAETEKSRLSDDDPFLLDWYNKNSLSPKSYYLIVGRFVPENNFETMIREFMRAKTIRSLAIITTVDEHFLDKLEQKLHFRKDSRIKFVGTMYDQELLKKIRENAFGYLHGHEVGGTNPSLLEALASTGLNLLLDVGFNREVAGDAALYWNKENGRLSQTIEYSEQMSSEEQTRLQEMAYTQIKIKYSWVHIAAQYVDVYKNRF